MSLKLCRNCGPLAESEFYRNRKTQKCKQCTVEIALCRKLRIRLAGEPPQEVGARRVYEWIEPLSFSGLMDLFFGMKA